jgi:glycine/D-amino acid oxidase-like deaminating enzyme
MIHKISVDSLVSEEKTLEPGGEEGSLLLAAVREVLPSVQAHDLEAVRTTTRPIPGDGLTCSGWVPGLDGYYVAVTHSGATMAPYLGKAVADEVVRGREHQSLRDFRPGRFFAGQTH